MSTRMTAPKANAPVKRKDGMIGLWGRLLHRSPDTYEKWLEERDMIMITATLLRLNERQLNRIGLSRKTLALDIEDLALRAARDAEIATEVLRIVEDDTKQEDKRDHAIAAE